MDVTQAYGKIINSIREAEEAARTADQAAQDALEVQDCLCLPLYVCVFVCVNLTLCLCVECKGPGSRPECLLPEEPQSGAEG